MVIETKSTFCLEDLDTLEIECKKCHAIAVFRINDMREFPQHCINCPETFTPGGQAAVPEALSKFRGAIDFFIRTADQQPFALRLSIKGSSGAKS